jgi:hypothetical protein
MVDLVKQAKQFAVSWVIYNLGLFLGSRVRVWRKNRKLRKMGVRTAPSSLNKPGRSFAIVTTAALPWRTGGRQAPGAVRSALAESRASIALRTALELE